MGIYWYDYLYKRNERVKLLKIKVALIITLLVFIMLSITYCFKVNPKRFLTINDVSMVQINPNSINEIVYKKDKNLKEIEEFINAYNKAKLTDNSLGTTHNNMVEIILSNNEKITVFGGTQGFQTVKMKGKQFNIKGNELWNFFKKLNVESGS